MKIDQLSEEVRSTMCCLTYGKLFFNFMMIEIDQGAKDQGHRSCHNCHK